MTSKKTTPVKETKTKKTDTKTVASKAKKPAVTKKEITDEEVRNKAEEIYQSRLATGEHGDHLSDWLTAEKALKSEE